MTGVAAPVVLTGTGQIPDPYIVSAAPRIGTPRKQRFALSGLLESDNRTIAAVCVEKALRMATTKGQLRRFVASLRSKQRAVA